MDDIAERDPGGAAPQSKPDPAVLAHTIRSLADHFSDHPGFMTTAVGFEVLHADWPAYPRGHGSLAALASFADFPPGTEFRPIDNIDRCTLFLVGRKTVPNLFDRSLLHIAIWDDDLRELARRGFLQGVAGLDDDLLSFPLEHITVTPGGLHAILVSELVHDLEPTILERVLEFVFLRRYDTAIREAALVLEQTLRRRAGEHRELHGHRLVEVLFSEGSTWFPSELPNSMRLELRAHFRRFFTYVRNEFAHNLKDIDLVTTMRLLRRCSLLLKVFHELELWCPPAH